MDRRKNMCHYIVPVYCGNRPAMTRGKPNKVKTIIFCVILQLQMMIVVIERLELLRNYVMGAKNIIISSHYQRMK